MIGTGYLSGNDNDNDGGWFNKFWNSDNNWFKKSWNSDNNWFKKSWDDFDFNKFMGFMNSGGSNNDDDDKDDCDDRKKDHKEHYDGYKKYYDDNKNYFDKGDYKKHLDDFKKYFDDNRQGFDKADFKQYMDYYKKYLEDNKKSFDKDDYDKYDKEYKKYTDEYPSHDDDCEDMDDNDDNTMVDHAIINFDIIQRKLKDGDQIYFQNIVDKCIFETEDSFAPLCVKCKFLNSQNIVIAKGKVIKLDKSYTGGTELPIPMSPVPWAAPYTPVANDVQNVDKVEITICGFKDKCPDDDHDKCKCDDRKKDHKKHYDDFDKYYKDNKNKFGKDGHSKYMDDYEKYMNDEGKYMDKSDYKMFMDYHEKYLKDNKKSFSSSDHKKHSSEHEKYSKDYPKHDEKCKCDDMKEDHKKHYDDFDKYYKDNKNKFGKDGHSKYMKDYEKYMNDEGKYMDKSDYKMFMDYHEKYLKDNKNSFSSSDYKRSSDEHKKYSNDYPKHDDDDDDDNDNECKEKSGFFVGGGKVYVPKSEGGTFGLTHGFELHCDATQGPNNLQIDWNGNKFHLEELESAKCIDDGTPNEPPPSPHPGPTLDIYKGEGFGRYNGECGAYAKWEMDDNGEPGKNNDQILSLQITKKDGTVIQVIEDGHPLKLQSGNHQFVPHPSSHPNPPTQTTPCPEITP